MGRPSGWSPPLLPAAWIYREENIHMGVWFLNCCCSPGGCGFSLSPLCEHPITWKTELVHGQNPPLKPPLLRICVACPSTAEIPALPPPPASDHHMQCPSRVFPAPGCAAAAGWAAGCLLLGRLWGEPVPTRTLTDCFKAQLKSLSFPLWKL